jgi:hypothetical protein
MAVQNPTRPDSDARVPYHVPSKAWAAKRVAQVLANGARERVSSTPLRGPQDVPASAEEITAEWLTAVLCEGHPGARVEHVVAGDGSVGTTTRQGLTITYNDAGTAAGLPTLVFVKCTTALAQRLVLGLGGFIEGEWAFYSNVRPGVDIEAPVAYFGAVDPRSWRSVTIMEDVARTKGARFWKPVTAATRSEAEDLIRDFATLHGTYWDSPQLNSWSWLKTPSEHLQTIDAFIGMERRSEVGAERARDVIPVPLRTRQKDLYTGMARSLEIASRSPHTYLNGDAHAGNTYVTESGRAGVADWQIGVRGAWSYDFAYILGTALDVEDRRKWERDLLALYLDRLHEVIGAVKLTPDAAWEAYRKATFYGYFAWVYTIGRARLQPRFQPDAISLPMIERSSAQIHDLESIKAVGL